MMVLEIFDNLAVNAGCVKNGKYHENLVKLYIFLFSSNSCVCLNKASYLMLCSEPCYTIYIVIY